MYIRFIIHEKDEDFSRNLEIFHAAGNLRDSGTLDPTIKLDSKRFATGSNCIERNPHASAHPKPITQARP